MPTTSSPVHRVISAVSCMLLVASCSAAWAALALYLTWLLAVLQGSTFGIPGVSEHTLPLRNVTDSVAIRSKLIENWNLANLPSRWVILATTAE